jgi:hypothetical protein
MLIFKTFKLNMEMGLIAKPEKKKQEKPCDREGRTIESYWERWHRVQDCVECVWKVLFL